jgi:hypothetical protein
MDGRSDSDIPAFRVTPQYIRYLSLLERGKYGRENNIYNYRKTIYNIRQWNLDTLRENDFDDLGKKGFKEKLWIKM